MGVTFGGEPEMRFRFLGKTTWGGWVSVVVLLFLLFAPHPAHSQQILQEFAAPGPEVRGLAWDGEYLWLVSKGPGLPVTKYIYKIDPFGGCSLTVVEGPAFEQNLSKTLASISSHSRALHRVLIPLL